jgi:MFS family permease
MNTVQTLDVRQHINGRKMSGYQWLLLFLCFLIVTTDGMDVAIMGFLAPAITKEWGISKAAFGVVMSAAPIGLAIGALLIGPLSDRYGRKRLLMGAVAWFGTFSILCSQANDVYQLSILRFLTGLGLGAAMPNTTTLLSEYVPEKSRGRLITIMFTGFNLGSALVGFGAAMILGDYGWRMVLVAGGVIPLICIPLYLFLIPESVRFMVVNKYPAERIATTLRRVVGGDGFSAPPASRSANRRSRARPRPNPAVAGLPRHHAVAVGYLFHGPAGHLPAQRLAADPDQGRRPADRARRQHHRHVPARRHRGRPGGRLPDGPLDPNKVIASATSAAPASSCCWLPAACSPRCSRSSCCSPASA